MLAGLALRVNVRRKRNARPAGESVPGAGSTVPAAPGGGTGSPFWMKTPLPVVHALSSNAGSVHELSVNAVVWLYFQPDALNAMSVWFVGCAPKTNDASALGSDGCAEASVYVTRQKYVSPKVSSLNGMANDVRLVVLVVTYTGAK